MTGTGLPIRLSEVQNCPLALREILVVGDKLARKRIDATSNEEVYDLEIDAIQIARDFVQEVFLRRLT